MSKNVISLIGDVFQREGGEVFEMRSPLFAFIQSTGVVTTITLVTTVRMMMIFMLMMMMKIHCPQGHMIDETMRTQKCIPRFNRL